MAKRLVVYDVKLVKESSKTYELETTKATCSGSAKQIVQQVLDIDSSPVEKFGLLCLDNQNNVIGVHVVTIGTIDQALTDARGVYQRALLNNARSIILFHNHPGGHPEPSQADIAATLRIVDAGNLLNITVLDHIICYDGGVTSMKERGLF